MATDEVTQQALRFFPVTYIVAWAAAIAGLISACIKIGFDAAHGFRG